MLLNDIGEGSSALFCLTDRPACCTHPLSNNRGAWEFPSGSSVQTTGPSFYFTRGFSSLQLNRRSSATGITGIFTCLIPSANNSAAQSIYVGIYSTPEDGESLKLFLLCNNNKSLIPSLGSLSGVSLSYDATSHTLSCVSSGGPVNTVTWRRNGDLITSTSPYQLSQTLMNGETSTYNNQLTITSGDAGDYNGTFTCTVSNSRGPSPTQTLDIHSMLCPT